LPDNSLHNMMIHSKTNHQLPITDNQGASGTFSTSVEDSLQIAPFLTNKPNFRKSQMNVNNLITMDYEKKDTWSSGKNKPNTKPIQTQYKPNSKPIQTQFKPKQTQFRRKKMLLYLTIKPGRNPLGYHAGQINAHNARLDRLKGFFSIFDLMQCHPESCILSLRDRIGHVFDVLTFKLYSYKLSPLFFTKRVSLNISKPNY